MPARNLLPVFALLAACTSGGNVAAQSAEKPFAVTEVATFDAPWAMTFLPDGRMLVTEKKGTLYLVSRDGKSRVVVTGTPPVMSEGQGALMDVVLHPQFATNRYVYFSYSDKNAEGLKGVVLTRGSFVDGPEPALRKVETLFRAEPYVEGNGHFSGRIAFSPDGHLFFTNGERQAFTPAQDPKVTLGKVLRLDSDGKPAAGNPLAAQGFHPAIWSYGHRNLLGLAFDKTGNLWEIEMGPKGGDEINLITPGAGTTAGRMRPNGTITTARRHPRSKPPATAMKRPRIWWNPSISPGGMIYYSGSCSRNGRVRSSSARCRARR
jgi:glucose/arabinose dehydrogenase